MAKKFGKILLFAAAAGSAAAAVYYYMQKRDAKTIADEDDPDDLPMEDFDASEASQDYVPLTPEAKEEAQPQAQAKTDSDFTPLSQQLNQTTDTEEETVEEFFSEEDDTAAN